ncbi:MAG: DUF3592 domain-containing protein [Clostridia bacterium]|nr:DUF3592 domain-containing protein [Clostridia bacterium]
MKNKTVKPDNLTVVHIGIMILTGVVCAIFLVHLVNAIKDYNIDAHANYVKEYATIVRYEEIYANNGRRTYSTFYEYEADNVVYYGLWQRLIEDEEEAKTKVGKQVPIYVDHALKRHRKDMNISSSYIWIAGAISLASFAIFLNSFIREIIYIVRWKNYKQANKSGNKR